MELDAEPQKSGFAVCSCQTCHLCTAGSDSGSVSIPTTSYTDKNKDGDKGGRGQKAISEVLCSLSINSLNSYNPLRSILLL